MLKERIIAYFMGESIAKMDDGEFHIDPRSFDPILERKYKDVQRRVERGERLNEYEELIWAGPRIASYAESCRISAKQIVEEQEANGYSWIKSGQEGELDTTELGNGQIVDIIAGIESIEVGDQCEVKMVSPTLGELGFRKVTVDQPQTVGSIHWVKIVSINPLNGEWICKG
jgi:hypothetical protein